MKRVSVETIASWINDARGSLRADLIEKSFRSCVLNLAKDGSEDFEIACFKAVNDAKLVQFY